MSGKAHVYKWQAWLPRADERLQIDILHQQIELLLEQVNELRAQADRTTEDLRKEIREAESRATYQVRQLASELRGERSQASRVDARGLGPIAFGIILTGLPDELAACAPLLGWTIVVVAVIWIAVISPDWLSDLRRALENSKG
jgi:hypothetical protein